jgi:hypothetical protein
MNNIAQTIANQIGSRAFLMMGAKNIVAGEDYVMFSVMQNAKKVAKVSVSYVSATDTYNVFFYNRSFKHIAGVDFVHFDQLRSVIESNTGLYLSL